jgi:hypothetical protein
MSEPLYKIAQNYQLALTELSEIDGLDPQVLADTLEGMAGDFETKSLNVAAYFLDLDAQADAIKEAERKMAARRKAIENHSQRLRDYLKQNMLQCGITRIDSPEFSLRVQKTAGSVVISEESLIPDDFVEIIETRKIDKTALREAIKNDPNAVIGAHIQENWALIIK